MGSKKVDVASTIATSCTNTSRRFYCRFRSLRQVFLVDAINVINSTLSRDGTKLAFAFYESLRPSQNGNQPTIWGKVDLTVFYPVVSECMVHTTVSIEWYLVAWVPAWLVSYHYRVRYLYRCQYHTSIQAIVRLTRVQIYSSFKKFVPRAINQNEINNNSLSIILYCDITTSKQWKGA